MNAAAAVLWPVPPLAVERGVPDQFELPTLESDASGPRVGAPDRLEYGNAPVTCDDRLTADWLASEPKPEMFEADGCANSGTPDALMPVMNWLAEAVAD